MNAEKNDDYKRLIKRHTPTSPLFKNSFLAFFGGGLICLFGEWGAYLFSTLGLSEKDAYLTVTLSYIVIASLLTGLGVFDRIARIFGAGTLVPVTGFSNALTSSALDTRSEGFVTGVGAKIFTVAGPVIIYSTIAGTLYGIIYFSLTSLFEVL